MSRGTKVAARLLALGAIWLVMPSLVLHGMPHWYQALALGYLTALFVERLVP